MAATLLAVDAGSSSVRLSAFKLAAPDRHKSVRASARQLEELQTNPVRTASAHFETSANGYSNGIRAMLDSFVKEQGLSDVCAVVHRVVHGGTRFMASCVITDEVENGLRGLTELAPLHIPSALAWVDICRSAFGAGIRQIAVFDTTFFARLPAVARHYAIPLHIEKSHGVHRFGFHGLAHQSMLLQVQALRQDLDRGGKMISIQLGGGCSIAAINRGTPLDTSMGFSPLEGLVMATRSGDVDPGLLLFLQDKGGMTADRLARMLNLESGLLGISGISGDMRKLLVSPSPDAALAIEVYCYRVRKYIGAFAAVLGGVDLIAFGGGVGENCGSIREKILDGMAWCGISIDRDLNSMTPVVGDAARSISKAGSPVDVRVVSVDEGVILAHEAARLLSDVTT